MKKKQSSSDRDREIRRVLEIFRFYTSQNVTPRMFDRLRFMNRIVMMNSRSKQNHKMHSNQYQLSTQLLPKVQQQISFLYHP